LDDDEYIKEMAKALSSSKGNNPLESDVQYNAEITRVHSVSINENMPNKKYYNEALTEDLTKANFNDSQENEVTYILEALDETISFAERFDRNMSFNVNFLINLANSRAIPSRGRQFTAVKVAKTQFQEVTRKADETMRAIDESSQHKRGLKSKLFG